MRAATGNAEAGKLNFGKGYLLIHKKIKRPLTEKILLRFPRLASALGAAGTRARTRSAPAEPGKLVTMMTASGSIDYIGKDKKSFQFYLRPMC